MGHPCSLPPLCLISVHNPIANHQMSSLSASCTCALPSIISSLSIISSNPSSSFSYLPSHLDYGHSFLPDNLSSSLVLFWFIFPPHAAMMLFLKCIWSCHSTPSITPWCPWDKIPALPWTLSHHFLSYTLTYSTVCLKGLVHLFSLFLNFVSLT